MQFLALFITLSTKQSAGRMRVWRALRGLGAATLRDGVYLLPESEEHVTALEQVVAEVHNVDGTAEIYLISGRDDAQLQFLIGLFDRREQYAVLLADVHQATPSDNKALRRLHRDFLALSAIDFFPGEAKRQAAEALAQLEAKANDEPMSVSGKIHRLDSANFQGRTWATRKHLWVDRMASAWLIRRFVDPQARFVWLTSPKSCPKKALGFDFDGATFTHVGGLVTFEVLAASFGLDNDPALSHIARIVHFLDAGGVPVQEASGIEAVLDGARATATDDDELLNEASRLFDNLYRHYTQVHPSTKNPPRDRS